MGIPSLGRVAPRVYCQWGIPIFIDTLPLSKTLQLNHARSFSYGYDAAGNQTLVVQGYDSAHPESTSYAYDARGNLIMQVTGIGSSQPDTTVFRYDGDGQVTQEIDPDGHTSDYGYDALGDQTEAIVGAGSSNPGTTHDSYDGDGNLTLSVNAVNDSTSYAYDADGHQIEMISGLNTPSVATVRYAYDAAGDQIEEIDPVGNTTSYEYDGDGNQTLMIQAVNTSVQASTAYQYDKDSNLTLQSNPNNTSIASSYNDQGEVTSEVWYSGSSVTNSVNYSYDGDGNVLTASNNAGAYSFAYNALSEVTQSVDPDGVTLTYQYDAEGDATQITDSLGDTVTSLYDANGNLIQRSATSPGNTAITVDLTHDNDGNLISLKRFGQVNGKVQPVGGETESYDAQGNLTYIVQADAHGNTLDSFSYSYDPAGQLIQEVDYNTGTTNYAYDATGQLTSAGATAYSYDANGNPTQSGDSVGPNNELLSDGTWNYSYDANGNLIGKTGVSNGLTWTYSYDAGNELIGATETNSQSQTLVQASYTYDVFGHRIESSVSTNGGSPVVTKFVYNGDTLWAEQNGSGNAQMFYLSGDQPDQWLARIDGSGTVGWYLTDDLGSVRDVMNNSSQVIAAAGYDVFGNPVSISNPSQLGSLTFDGMYWDAPLGTYNDFRREFDPAMHRFWSPDPSGLGPDSNAYRFVQNDPTNMVDPSGEAATWAQGWMESLAKSDPMVYYYLKSGRAAWNIAETSGGFLWSGNRTKESYVKDGVLHIYIGQNYSQQEALTYISSKVRELSGFKKFDTPARQDAVDQLSRIRESNASSSVRRSPFYHGIPEPRAAVNARAARNYMNSRMNLIVSSYAMGYVSFMTAVTPGVNVLVPAYEAIAGKDIFGNELSTTERDIAGGVASIPVIGRVVGKVAPLLRATEKGTPVAKELEESLQAVRTAKSEEEITAASALFNKASEDAAKVLSAPEGKAAARKVLTLQMAPGNVCFVAGTPLLTPDGSKLIEQFQPGDWVLSRSEFDPDGPLTAQVVEAVFKRVGRVLHLHIGGQVIRTTTEHPFWVYNRGCTAPLGLDTKTGLESWMD